jgi:putative transposase
VRRAVATILVEEHTRSVRSACRIVGLSRTAFARPPAPSADADAPIIAALMTLIAQEHRWGFWKCRHRLRDLGHMWNHKRIYRVYCAIKLNQVRRTKKRVPTRVKVPLQAVAQLNDTWAMDFMGDTLYSARRYRIFNVIDEGNREALAIEVDVSLPSERVVAVLDQLVEIHGAPRRIRCDNGPEFVAEAVQAWCARHGITLVFIQPGKPNQNAYFERFSRTYRTEILNTWVFTTLDEVRELTEAWRQPYNTEQTHDSLGAVPPLTFLPRATSPDLSYNAWPA